MRKVAPPPKPRSVDVRPPAQDRHRSKPLLLSRAKAQALREIRKRDPGKSRMVKWVCSHCGQIARIASASKPVGSIRHETKWDRQTKQMVPCGGVFVECTVPR
jgi:hypothetical protein